MARNRILTEVKALLVRVYEDPIEDYLALAGTLGATNHSSANSNQLVFYARSYKKC